jgi:VCBS repeat-containing protein
LLQGNIVAGPQHGQVSVAADGSFTYLADANYNGADSFTYKVNDGELDSNLATVMLTIVPVNDAPTAGDQSLSTDEDTPITGSLLAVAADIDSALLQGSIVAGPQHGQVSVAADGSFTYTSDANYNGTDSFTYKVNDGDPSTSLRTGLDSAIATVMLTIIPVNDAPVASAIAAALLEDGRITLNLLGSAGDVDGDPLSVSIGNPQHGQLLKNADGSYTYLPQADYNGEDGFSYSVSDGRLDSGPAMVRLTITAVNDAPVAQDDIAILDEDHSIQLAIMANDYDVDGDSLSLAIVNQPANGTLVVNADHTVSYTPLANWSGEDSFSYKLNDGDPSASLRTGLDSGVATVRLIVTAMADAPTLVLSEVGGASRELFRTGWESVGNRNTNSTLLEQRELEGWVFVAHPEQNRDDDDDDRHDHDRDEDHGSFEIWSSGDKMRDAEGKRTTVNAASGTGSNWLELNNAKGEGHQTPGIERSIETIAGAVYILNLDLAGHLGYDADTTRIGIYLDGVKIGSDDSTSPSTALNWQTRSFQFVGKGEAQTLRIVSEAGRRESNGRGMMIDNIALTETLQANTGFEDASIPLSAIGAALRDTDGSETLNLSIEAIPVGAMLTDGANRFTASQDNTTADVTGWNLGKLAIMPPKDFNGQFDLKVVATTTEQANQAKATVEASLQVTVLPVNDAPLANSAGYTLTEGGSIDFAELISDVDGDVLTLNFSNPKQGTLTKNADASPELGRRSTYTYTPKHEFSGTETFTYTVSDGKLSATADITLTVLPKNDDDEEDHHDNGLHHGFEHSGHNGYQNYDDQWSAKIIVQSVHAAYEQQNDDWQDSIVINQGSQPAAHAFTVDWQGSVANQAVSTDDEWLAEYVGNNSKQKTLAEITGLTVKV